MENLQLSGDEGSIPPGRPSFYHSVVTTQTINLNTSYVFLLIWQQINEFESLKLVTFLRKVIVFIVSKLFSSFNYNFIDEKNFVDNSIFFHH